MKNIIYLSLMIICLAFFVGETAYAQKEKKYSKKEKKALKIKQEEQMQKELNGFIQADAEYNCQFEKKNYKVAILPFTAKESEHIDASYSPDELLREYFESYLSRLGWTVVGRERTDNSLPYLQKIVTRNVLDEEVRDIKEKVGADVFVTGRVNSFTKGTSGSPGSDVSFTVRCQILETACREIWSGTVESRSGAYNYDKSPIFQLKDAVKEYFVELNQSIDNCNTDEKK